MNQNTSMLQQIQSATNKYASGFWVPSLQRDVRFREITTSQQKRLIKSVIDSPVYNIEFNNTMRDIFKENLAENDVDISTLTLLDKLVLCVGFRAVCIGNQIDMVIDHNGKKVDTSVNLTELYNRIKSEVKLPGNELITYEDIQVEAGVPTMRDEQLCDMEAATNKISSIIDAESPKEIRDITGHVFVREIVKYIKNISIRRDTTFISIPWNGESFATRIQAVELLPVTLLKQILKYLEKVTAEVNKIEIIKVVVDSETVERRLSINGDFFTIS